MGGTRDILRHPAPEPPALPPEAEVEADRDAKNAEYRHENRGPEIRRRDHADGDAGTPGLGKAPFHRARRSRAGGGRIEMTAIVASDVAGPICIGPRRGMARPLEGDVEGRHGRDTASRAGQPRSRPPGPEHVAEARAGLQGGRAGCFRRPSA
jgi:hypothetical protein